MDGVEGVCISVRSTYHHLVDWTPTSIKSLLLFEIVTLKKSWNKLCPDFSPSDEHQHRTEFADPPGGCFSNIFEIPPNSDFYDLLTYQHHNWAQFGDWDWVARRIFAGQPHEFVLILHLLHYRTDAYSGSLNPEETYSPDGKTDLRDCLHHPIPGPISLLPQLQLHLFEVPSGIRHD